MVFCAVVNCGSRAERDNVNFFRIPSVRRFIHKTYINELSKLRREKWIRCQKGRFERKQVKIYEGLFIAFYIW